MVRVYFFALTLNPMGKTQCLESSDYAGGYAAKAKCSIEPVDPFTLQAEVWVSGLIHCGPAIVFTAKTSVKDPERSMEFVIFLYQYRYDSSHLIPSNGPELFFFF